MRTLGTVKEPPPEITLAEMRAAGVRGLLIYAAITFAVTEHSGDRWPDQRPAVRSPINDRLSDLERRFYLPGLRQASRRCAARLAFG
jgi:hypothetical protein